MHWFSHNLTDAIKVPYIVVIFRFMILSCLSARKCFIVLYFSHTFNLQLCIGHICISKIKLFVAMHNKVSNKLLLSFIYLELWIQLWHWSVTLALRVMKCWHEDIYLSMMTITPNLKQKSPEFTACTIKHYPQIWRKQFINIGV